MNGIRILNLDGNNLGFVLLNTNTNQKVFIDVSKKFGVTADGINKAIDLARLFTNIMHSIFFKTLKL